MTCKNCGAEIPENETRCPKCGAAIEAEPAAQTAEVAAPETPRGFSNKRNILIIAIALVVLIIGGAVTAVAVTRGGTQSAESIMTLAERYLKEEKYEQAVIEFQRVIELDPMNVDAYLNLAEAYLGLGDKEKALEVLREGLEKTGDSRLQAKIDELTKPTESSNSSSTVQTSSSTSSDTTTSTPAVEELAYELKATREYDRENRIYYEQVTSPDGTITTTDYMEYEDGNGNIIGWGVNSKQIDRIDENGDTIPVSNYSYDYDGTLDCEALYNDKGDIIYRKSYDGENETSVQTYKYEYGPFGMLSQVETIVDTDNGESYTRVYTTNYTYDANGMCISRTETSSEDTEVYTTKYERESDGRLISETVTRSDGIRRSYIECKYDAADPRRRTEFRSMNYNDDGSLRLKKILTRKYNDAGRCIEYYQSEYRVSKGVNPKESESIDIEKYNDAGKLIERTRRENVNGLVEYEGIGTYSYDDKGRRIEAKRIDKVSSETNAQTTTYTYNENERVVHTTETTTFADGREAITEEYTKTYVCEYDELGRIILETRYDKDGNFAGKTEYEY